MRLHSRTAHRGMIPCAGCSRHVVRSNVARPVNTQGWRGLALLSVTATSLAIGAVQAAECPACQECRIIEPPETGSVFSAPETWPDGIVPFEFADNVTPQNRDRVHAFMDEVRFWSDVEFVPRQGDEAFWVTIRSSSSGNSATVGPARGGVVNINAWESPGFIAHELMHTLGFAHEQSRPDRDQYVEVICECIQGGCSNGNFAIIPDAEPIGLYDFESVMHYPSTFALAPCPDGRNIRPLPLYDQYRGGMGDWSFNYDGLSNADIWALAVKYGGDPVPGPFSLLEPPTDADVARLAPVRFEWSESGGSDFYRVEISNTPRARGNLVDTTTIETFFTLLSPATEEELFWRVTAVNDRGETPARLFEQESVTVGEGCGLDLSGPPGVGAADIAELVLRVEAQDAAVDFSVDGVLDMRDVLAYLRLFDDPAVSCQ